MDLLTPVGRLLYSLVFISGGIFHVVHHRAMTEAADSAGMPLAGFMVYLSGAMIFFGGLSILLGYYARIGALLVTVFVLTAAFTIHRFWLIADPQMAAIQTGLFMRNLALGGGGFLLMSFGSGPYSLRDWKPERTRAGPTLITAPGAT